MINRYWLLILALAVALGVWLGQPLLTLGGLFGLLLAGSELLWTRHCLTGVEYERSLSRSHAAWGEDLTLTVRIANRKLLPLTWLLTQDMVPVALPFERRHVVDGAEGSRWAYVRNLLPMLPYEQVVRRYTIPCRHRGRFEFGPAKVESGDLLGYSTRTLNASAIDSLIVYPKLFELDLPAPASRRIAGPQALKRTLLPDPSRTIGLRGYQPGDPLRHVDWRSSARSRELQVRIFEPTTDLALAIFLNFRVRPAWGDFDDPQLEFAISLAASLARWALNRKYPTGMFGNGAHEDTGAVRVPMSGDPDQARRILEALALASPFGRKTIAQVMLDEAAQLPFEASVVLITASFDRLLLTAMEEVQRRRPLTVWYVKMPSSPAVHLPGFNTLTVDYDEQWMEREQLQLAA